MGQSLRQGLNTTAGAKAHAVIRFAYIPCIAIALPLLMWNGGVQQANATFGDLLFRVRDSARGASIGRFTLVAIDDSTVSRYGPLPLRRSSLATAIRRISEFRPRVIAVDLLLSEPTRSDEDIALAEALGSAPACVLGAALESDPGRSSRWILPLPVIANSHAVGHVHAEPDADGSVRSILLAKSGGNRRFWALSVEAALVALSQSGPVLERRASVDLGQFQIPAREGNARLMHINYAGPEGTFRRISLASILDGTARPASFNDKVVIIGVTAQGGGDRMFTPVSTGIGMSGMEIHANALRTILDRDFLQPLSPATELAIAFLVAAVSIVGVGALRGFPLFIGLTAIGVSVPIASLVAFRLGYIWPTASLLGVFIVATALVGTGEYAAIWLRLRSAERQRRAYAFRVQAIAHEIKTPLTAIQGSSEIISDELLPETQRQQIAGMIHRESKRLTQIIHAFLDVERIAAGSLELQLVPVTLQPLCDDLLERARLYATRKRIHVESDLPPVTILADPELLSFAIYNLLTNAVKYSPKETTVTLTAVDSADFVRVSVVDEGYGIAKDEQGRIFERFYRSHRAEAASEEGTGVGLALVREIAAQHGGHVEVDSKEGMGSRFTIVLPKSHSWNQHASS